MEHGVYTDEEGKKFEGFVACQDTLTDGFCNMSAVEFTFCCGDCGRRFSAPGVLDFSYGEFVLRGKRSNHEAFLDANSDPAFLESRELLKAHPKVAGMSDWQRAELLHEIFGSVCDPTPDGQPLVMNLHPQCPSCGSRNMESWVTAVPGRPWPLPLVTHNVWNALSRQQRIEMIDRAIRERLEET